MPKEAVKEIAREVLVTKSDLIAAGAVAIIWGFTVKEWATIAITASIVIYKLAQTWVILRRDKQDNQAG